MKLVVHDMRRPWLPAWLQGLGAAAFVTIGLMPRRLVLADLALVCTLCLLQVVAFVRFRLRRGKPATVEVKYDGIHVDGRLAVSRERIVDGHYVPKQPPMVRIVDRERETSFSAEVSSEEQALELLGALGLTDEHRRTEFTGLRWSSETIGRVFVAFAGAFIVGWVLFHATLPHWGGAFIGLFSAGIAAMNFMARTSIVLGTDGTLVRSRGDERFIPHADVTRVMSHARSTVALYLESGPVELIHTKDPSHQLALSMRIERAVRGARIKGSANVSALVGRQGRTRNEWLEALHRLKNDEGTYREIAVREDDLWRLLEDPAAPEDARAGAALVLRRSLDDSGKARIRVAARTTASPRLRVALEDTAEGTGDDDVLLELEQSAARAKYSHP
jgi:hypothetical protein